MKKQRYQNPPDFCKRARQLRMQSSLPEYLLWQALSAQRKESNLKFRRQHPIHPYIADFACIQALLIVELDGPSHDHSEAYDAKREATLRLKGWSFLRFTNEDVLKNLRGIILMIQEKAKQRILALPNPPASGRGRSDHVEAAPNISSHRFLP